MTDLMISNSKKTTEIYRRALWYSGMMLECGSPRNDIMFKNTSMSIEKVKKCFGIEEQKIVTSIYAVAENFLSNPSLNH